VTTRAPDEPNRPNRPHEGEPREVAAAAERRVNVSPWSLLLLLPLVATLFPMVYNREGPTLGSWPFFYWYQMLASPFSVLVTLVVYRATRGDR